MLNRSSWFAASLLAVFFVMPAPAAEKAFEFPPITAEEKALTEVRGYPNAPAVVLSKVGRAEFYSGALGQLAARLRTHLRIKILTAQGRSWGEIRLMHWRYGRLRGLQGRTMLPDGRILPLPESAIFERKVSDNERIYETLAAFPSVEVGSILDLVFETQAKYALLLPAWEFNSELPTLRSEVSYDGREVMELRPWLLNPMGLAIEQTQLRETPRQIFKAVALDLPPLPAEPLAPSDRDLTARMMVFHGRIFDEKLGRAVPTDLGVLLRYAANAYRKVPGRPKRIPTAASSSAGDGASSSPAAAQIYRHVRDDLRTSDVEGLFPEDELRLDEVQQAGEASPAVKAILLARLLDMAGFKTTYAFTSGVDHGSMEMSFPTISQVERVLVGVEIGGSLVALDPTDPCLAFGKLGPSFQGRPAYLAPGIGKVTGSVQLPSNPPSDNRRHAKLLLESDPGGSLSGTVLLRFEGAHAWRACQRGRSEDTPDRAWRTWLEEALPDFVVSEVRVTNDVDDSAYEVGFRLATESDGLEGDEITFSPSLPWGPLRQPLSIDAAERKTDVLLPFASTEEVELELRWPEAWSLDLAPVQTNHVAYAGNFQISMESDPSARQLRYQRRLTLAHQRFGSRNAYVALQRLYAELEKSDAQAIVLVRR